MSNSNFIVSGSGFFVGSERILHTDPENPEKVLSLEVKLKWTHILREASKFTTKQATSLINKLHLEAFVWRPLKEEPIKDKWEIVRKSAFDFYDWERKNENLSMEWIPKKVIMKSKTDADFVASLGHSDYEESFKKYMPYEDAVKLANEKNIAMFEDLKSKIL